MGTAKDNTTRSAEVAHVPRNLTVRHFYQEINGGYSRDPSTDRIIPVLGTGPQTVAYQLQEKSGFGFSHSAPVVYETDCSCVVDVFYQCESMFVAIEFQVFDEEFDPNCRQPLSGWAFQVPVCGMDVQVRSKEFFDENRIYVEVGTWHTMTQTRAHRYYECSEQPCEFRVCFEDGRYYIEFCDGQAVTPYPPRGTDNLLPQPEIIEQLNLILFKVPLRNRRKTMIINVDTVGTRALGQRNPPAEYVFTLACNDDECAGLDALLCSPFAFAGNLWQSWSKVARIEAEPADLQIDVLTGMGTLRTGIVHFEVPIGVYELEAAPLPYKGHRAHTVRVHPEVPDHESVEKCSQSTLISNVSCLLPLNWGRQFSI